MAVLVNGLCFLHTLADTTAYFKRFWPAYPTGTNYRKTCNVSLSTVITPRSAQARETLIVDSWLTEETSRIKIRKRASENQYEVCLG